MLEILLDRTTVIGLAIVGGVFSMLATWCQSQGKLSEKSIFMLNRTAYVFMGISIVLFISAGFYAGWQ
tara:strand:+ start:300 stop:503 length:204 start_codon:yes stop_codon:yes gene_type:complete